MKATDLMIGDWVLYRPGWIDDDTKVPVYESKEGIPVRLTCIYDDVAQYDDVLPDGTINTIEVADFELFPIPISPEILEKNGFKQIDKGGEVCITGEWWWGEEGKRNFTIVTITFYKGLNSGVRILTKIETDCSYESGINMIHSCDIESVHELQHALKLCGIEKEMVL